MNFYLAALDDLERKPGDNPSIGLILCREHNRVVVEYALRNVDTPIGVARYHAGMADQAVLLLAPVFSETILIPYCWPSAPQNQCGGHSTGSTTVRSDGIPTVLTNRRSARAAYRPGTR
jgi:hypothetical protein